MTERYGLAEGRVVVVPHGVDSAALFGDTAGCRWTSCWMSSRYGTPYVFGAGTVLERRMPRQVLEAFAISQA